MTIHKCHLLENPKEIEERSVERNQLFVHPVEREGRGGSLVETITFNRRVVGSNPALAAT